MAPQHSNPEDPKLSNPLGCLARIYWMALGNIVLIFSAILIAKEQNREGYGLFSVIDLIFWGGVFALIVFRHLDFKYFTHQTATGEPATASDFRKYCRDLVIWSLAIWALAHGIASVWAA